MYVHEIYNIHNIGIYLIIFSNNIYQENKDENNTNPVIAAIEHICGR
jgi:hypothetical protein